MRRRHCLLAAYCFACAGNATAEALPCDLPLILVDTAEPELHQRVCYVVMEALPRLKACHLRQERPITIRFNDALSPSNADCLGMYHGGKDQIDLLTPEAFETAHLQSDYCQGISEAEHFNSIIVHELSHALLDQASGGKVNTLVDQEYIAYSMQLDMMREPVRDRLLSDIGLALPISAESINEFVLLFSPSIFAATSWLHFSSQEKGCDFVGEIIQGKQTLWQEPY